ncbi:hypothetical protein C9I89_16320 [Photobacterium lipolyticum]|uniref:Uncharacterized protein n=2 Tax=Photobacterium lipolyticum TaxID=266810 RepID=A0A2T3MUZ9_9GAMM|nr:hypothetical protein C9I89_16320 [Photobacterium lipolyticum]
MPNLTFRAGTAIDGTRFALLTDQGDITDPFDNAYKISYRDRGLTENSYQLPTWEAAYTASSKPFEMIPESRELPQSVQDGFTTMVAALIKGVDVFFCDYNLAISDDHPMCNEIMDKYRNTDFVLFSCADIVGSDPSQQPYCVSYAAPRYDSKTNPAVQHRIYCKTEAFAFLQAVNAIVHQRTIDQYAGGNIREEHRDPLINASDATRELNQFIDVIGRLQGEVKALPGASS